MSIAAPLFFGHQVDQPHPFMAAGGREDRPCELCQFGKDDPVHEAYGRSYTTLKPLEEQLGCFGYFGFGAGFALVKFASADDTSIGYCNRRCASSAACWAAHRTRVSALFPALAELAQELTDGGFKGPAYVQEWQKRAEDQDGKLSEPYLSLSMANAKDGIAVGGNLPPEPHGANTLTWPLAPIARPEV